MAGTSELRWEERIERREETEEEEGRRLSRGEEMGGEEEEGSVGGRGVKGGGGGKPGRKDWERLVPGLWMDHCVSWGEDVGYVYEHAESEEIGLAPPTRCKSFILNAYHSSVIHRIN